MTVTLYSDFKIVWKYLKLARLIHEITQSSDGYTIRLTGPTSVFRYMQRYGIRMALFLPELLLAQRFTMEALVNVIMFKTVLKPKDVAERLETLS